MHGVEIEIEDTAWIDDVLHIPQFKIELPYRSITVLAGSSGTGKSTLLKAIAGWHNALLSKRRSIRTLAESAIIDDDAIGYMPQDTEDLVLPWYSVSKNLDVARDRRSSANIDIREYALGLGLTKPDLAKRPRNLSGGMERRLALGMVLLRKPSLLLLDEPFTGLDVNLRVKMWSHLHRYVHAGQVESACLMVTHTVEDAVALGTHVIRVRINSGDSALVFDEPCLRPEGLAGRSPESLFDRSPEDSLAADWAEKVRAVFASIGRETS